MKVAKPITSCDSHTRTGNEKRGGAVGSRHRQQFCNMLYTHGNTGRLNQVRTAGISY